MKNTKILCALVIGMMVISSIPLFATAQATNDELVIALQQDMLSMNPWDPDTNDVWKSFQIGWNFEGLMTYNPDYELYPVLATKNAAGPNGADAWVSPDGMQISLNINQGVTFHDGHVLDSQDVVFSYQTLAWGLYQTQVLTPLYWDDGTTFPRYDGSGVSHIGVEANGTYRVDFHLTSSYAMFWYLTLAVPIMPYHIWSAHTIALAAEDYPYHDVTNEMGWDYSYGNAVTETDATIGTGPLMLESWVKEQGSVIKPYTNYWDKTGTTTWKSIVYPNYPQHVKKIRFKIYTQLDVAILALQNGDVHHLPWSLTPGYYNLLKTDPNIGIEENKDQGFFYMSFNFRKGAMADVNFRRAVSYCVDKQYIVDRLMGGYGIQGSVPISVTNTFYVNTSVPAWIQGGNLQAASDLLNASGYTDKDGDGWRDMPDGSPLKYNILTPPKDYDPIRADSGIMIEKNLKAIGLNIASVPTSFDTIVSAAYVSLDFDIYILGWSVGSFPESYLRDFFHGESDVAVNPAGSNAAGYHNASVDAMIDAMEVEMDSANRAKLIKDICGATMMDVPYDTLYYRTNIEAYRQDIWQGWIPAFGTIYNGFSIFNLAPPGTGGGGGGGAGGETSSSGGSTGISEGTPDYFRFTGNFEVESKMSIPSMAGAGQTISGTIMATDVYETGGFRTTKPSEGATVNITTSFGQTVTTTTDAEGMADFEITLPYLKINSVWVNANTSKGSSWYVVNKTIGIEFTNHIAQLNLYTDDGVIAPGALTVVTAKVTDENGNPISNVSVQVDTALMFGTVDSAVKTTGADGIALFNYTAPPVAMLPNTHRYEQFKANITVQNTIMPEIQSASLIIGISSDNYDWHDLDITDVTEYVLDNNGGTPFPTTTMITLNLTDQDGTVIPDFPVSINLSEDGTVIDAEALIKNTNSEGVVMFNLTVDGAYTGSGTVIATFNTSKTYSIRDSVAIYIRNYLTPFVDTYHMNVTCDVDTIDSNPDTHVVGDKAVVSVTLYDDTWTEVPDMDIIAATWDDGEVVELEWTENTTDATGVAVFNLTAVGTDPLELSMGFYLADSIGISQGYVLPVNMVTITEVVNETVPTGGQGDQGPWNLANVDIYNCTLYLENATVWVEMVEGVDYNLDYETGEITPTSPIYGLQASDSIYAYYNYSEAFTQTLGQINVTSVTTDYMDADLYSATPNSVTITVQLMDPATWTPIAGETVYNWGYDPLDWDGISGDWFNTTNATGEANFTTTTTSADARTFMAMFNATGYTGTSGAVCIYNGYYQKGYAADVNFTGVLAHQSNTTITATVYDETGAPAVGVPCQFFIPPTAEGIPGVFRGGDSWGWTEYDSSNNTDGSDGADGIIDEWDLGWWAGYIGSWFENNATVTDGAGQITATIDTPSFLADVEIPLQFGVGGTGVAEGFNTSANNWWMEYEWHEDAPPLTDELLWGPYYWEKATFTLRDQVILLRAPIATMTKFQMDTPFLSKEDPNGTFTITYQDLAGNLATTDVGLSKGTASPLGPINDGTTSSTGVYTQFYNDVINNTWNIEDPDNPYDDHWQEGITTFNTAVSFTTSVLDANYAKFPFNFYIPYLADGTTAKTLVVNSEAVEPVAVMGEEVTLAVTVKDEYGRIVDGATVTHGTATNTTNATGVAHLTIPMQNPSTAGPYEIPLDVTKNPSTEENAYVQLVSPELFLSTEYWNLNATVPTVNVPFNITFNAKNNWSYDGYAFFDLIVDGHVVNTQLVELAGMQTKVVLFNYTLMDTVNHTVSVAQSGRRALSNWTVAASSDFDGDGIADNTDTDDDNDGVLDTEDAFPMNPTEWADLDDDNIGDNADADVDGDGVNNTADDFPWDANETVDTDGDGTGDNADTDDDGDGILDTEDTNPQTYDVPEAEAGGLGAGVVAGVAIAMLVVGLLIGFILFKFMAGKEAKPEEPAEKATEPEKPAQEPAKPAETAPEPKKPGE